MYALLVTHGRVNRCTTLDSKDAKICFYKINEMVFLHKVRHIRLVFRSQALRHFGYYGGDETYS